MYEVRMYSDTDTSFRSTTTTLPHVVTAAAPTTVRQHARYPIHSRASEAQLGADAHSCKTDPAAPGRGGCPNGVDAQHNASDAILWRVSKGGT